MFATSRVCRMKTNAQKKSRGEPKPKIKQRQPSAVIGGYTIHVLVYTIPPDGDRLEKTQNFAVS